MKNDKELATPAEPAVATTTTGKSTRLMSTAAASLSSTTEWLRSEVQKIRKPNGGDTSEKTISSTVDGAMGVKGVIGTTENSIVVDGEHTVSISRPPAAVEGVAAVVPSIPTKNVTDPHVNNQHHQSRRVDGAGADTGTSVAELVSAHRATSPPLIPSTISSNGIASILPTSVVESLTVPRVRPISPVEVAAATNATTSTSAGNTFSVTAALRSMASVPKNLLKSKVPTTTTITTDSTSGSNHAITATATVATKRSSTDVQTSLDRIAGHRFSSESGLLKKTSADKQLNK